MCDPVTLGSIAVGTAGGLISSKDASDNQRNMIEARNRATMGELARDKAYGNESRGIFDNSLSGYATDPSAAQATSTAAIQSNAPTNVGSITSTNAPKVVGDRESTKLASVFERAAGQDKALGTLKGYDANNVNNQIHLNGGGRDIDMIGDFAKTSAGVNAIEQRAASQNASRPPSMLGQLLQTAGQIGSYYGGKGGTMFPRNAAAPASAAFNPTQLGALY